MAERNKLMLNVIQTEFGRNLHSILLKTYCLSVSDLHQKENRSVIRRISVPHHKMEPLKSRFLPISIFNST